ncbi:MAG TPA: thioredoxin family protein [Bacteroidales bacterium]|nr:thioredoxin family protein [Bacteroidales bacterium]HPE57103.1 thioredoxin family protein [Bacteroidales bacterium]HRX97568.1 thioredoxin family protein [Bacteroidales bacterium]
METTLNAATVSQLISEEVGVLLYFYNDDCAPCISLRPKVEELMQKRFPKMKVLWVNSKTTPEIPASYSVFANPTILVFFDGKEFKRFSKYVSVNELEASIERYYSLAF